MELITIVAGGERENVQTLEVGRSPALLECAPLAGAPEERGLVAKVATKIDFMALPVARVPRRLAALVYDALLLLAIGFAYTAGILLIQVQQFGAREGQPLGWLGGAGLWFCLSLYYVWCWRRSGQTLGMKTWRLRLQRVDGGPPSWMQCWLRCLIAPVVILAFGVGYWWALFCPSGNCLQDSGSRTRVVVLPKSAGKRDASIPLSVRDPGPRP